MDIFEFLKTNYRGFASDAFEPIYMSSTEIIRVLEEISSSPLGQIKEKIPDWRATVEREALDLKYWIREIEHFPTIVSERLSSFLTMLEDALIDLESRTRGGLRRVLMMPSRVQERLTTNLRGHSQQCISLFRRLKVPMMK